MKYKFVQENLFDQYYSVYMNGVLSGYIFNKNLTKDQLKLLKKKIEEKTKTVLIKVHKCNVDYQNNKLNIIDNTVGIIKDGVIANREWNCWYYTFVDYVNQKVYDVEREEYGKIVDISGNRYTIEYKNGDRIFIDISSKRRQQRHITEDNTLLNRFSLVGLKTLLKEFKYFYFFYNNDKNMWYSCKINNIDELSYLTAIQDNKLTRILNDNGISPKILQYCVDNLSE